MTTRVLPDRTAPRARRSRISAAGVAAIAGVGAVLLATVASSFADVSVDVRNLPHRRAVILPADATAGWYAIIEDSLLAAGSGPEFTDLRLVDAEGRSRPLRAEPPARSRTRYVVIREMPVVWAEGEKGTREMVVDLGADAAERLSVEVTGLSAGAPLKVTGRDSTAAEWVFLAVDREAGESPAAPPPRPSARVDLGETRRFLRLQQENAPAPGEDDRVRLLARVTEGAALLPVELRPVVGRFRGAGRNEWQAEIPLAGPARVLTRLDLRWADGQAGRATRLEAKLPKGGWRDVVAEAESTRAGDVASLGFRPVRTTALRLHVFGASAPNAPCTIEAAQATPQRWLFRAEGPESLAIAYGDPFLVTVPDPGAAPEIGDIVREASLGPVEPNPFHAEVGFGLEWLKRRPGVLGALMIGLLGVVVWLALTRGTTAGRRTGPE